MVEQVRKNEGIDEAGCMGIVGGFFLSLSIPIYQFYFYLKYGEWKSYSLLWGIKNIYGDGIELWFGRSDWAGLRKIIYFITDWTPAFIALFLILAILLPIVIGIILKLEELLKRVLPQGEKEG